MAIASTLRSQAPWQPQIFISGSKTVCSRLGSDNKHKRLNLARFSHDEYPKKGTGLKIPSWTMYGKNLHGSTKSTVFLDRTSANGVLKFRRRLRNSRPWEQDSAGRQHDPFTQNNYFDSFDGFLVTDVTLYTDVPEDVDDIDSEPRLVWHGLDWELLPGRTDSEEDEVMGDCRGFSTDIVPMDFTSRALWLRIDLELSKEGVKKIVSYMDFNGLNYYGWINEKLINAEHIVAHLQAALCKGEPIHVVRIRAEMVHGYFYRTRRWFGLMQVVLREGKNEIILGDMRYHVGTGPWPDDIPYTYGYQGEKNTWFCDLYRE